MLRLKHFISIVVIRSNISTNTCRRFIAFFFSIQLYLSLQFLFFVLFPSPHILSPYCRHHLYFSSTYRRPRVFGDNKHLLQYCLVPFLTVQRFGSVFCFILNLVFYPTLEICLPLSTLSISLFTIEKESYNCHYNNYNKIYTQVLLVVQFDTLPMHVGVGSAKYDVT